MRQPSRFSEVGFESLKMGAFFCCLGAQNGLTFTGTARRRFSPLSAGNSVLDALWIVAIILEQPAYALIVPSRLIRFWLLILSLCAGDARSSETWEPQLQWVRAALAP